jgi:hypothetical protein
MDVSGSMDQATKDMAKRFYLLLYMFLKRHYERTEVVFIRHHTTAREVDEHDFFYSRETGGTVVSSALKLMKEIIDDRYSPDAWNIYAAQASDGDNWNDDSPLCGKLLSESLLPLVQYYAYIEITQRSHQALWREYERWPRPIRTPSPCAISPSRATSFRCSTTCSRSGTRHDAAAAPIATGSDWTFELIRELRRRDRRACPGVRARYLPEPDRDHPLRSDDGCLRLGGHADQLSPLVVRQAVRHRGKPVPARADGARLRDRHQLRPCIAYLMEENTFTMQALVIAHACYGHNSFFKGNYLFRTWTDAGSIIDYLLFARNYIAECESATACARSRRFSMPATRS